MEDIERDFTGVRIRHRNPPHFNPVRHIISDERLCNYLFFVESSYYDKYIGDHILKYRAHELQCYVRRRDIDLYERDV